MKCPEWMAALCLTTAMVFGSKLKQTEMIKKIIRAGGKKYGNLCMMTPDSSTHQSLKN